MKLKLLLTSIIIVLLFTGCEKDYDGILDYSRAEYQVLSISPKDNFTFSPVDSTIIFSIRFSSSSIITETFCNIHSPDGSKIHTGSVSLLDDGRSENGDHVAGDNIYSARFPFSSSFLFGDYSVKYYVKDASNIDQVAAGKFFYDNGQFNVAPKIFNLIMVDSSSFSPIDSIQVGVTFIFSVTALDSNGYADISRVYFELYRPDSTIVTDGFGNSKIQMFDNGNFPVFGDQIAGDSIFSFKNKFLDSTSTQRGNWKFEFRTEDRRGSISNTIIKNLKVL